jgi:4-hydroxyacetophenone monooxygenase
MKVTSATFKDGRWTLEMEEIRSGVFTKRDHSFLMSSVGQLNIPIIPTAMTRTMHRFKGEAQFHTARWPDGLDLRNKRVAIVGTGKRFLQMFTHF